jgi:hypothetical protein
MLSFTADATVAQEAKFVAALKLPGTLDSLAQEMWMKVIGSKACKIEKDLPKADMDAIFRVMNNVDAEGVKIAQARAQAMVRGSPAPLKPGSLACKVVAQQIEASKVIYETLAASARVSN